MRRLLPRQQLLVGRGEVALEALALLLLLLLHRLPLVLHAVLGALLLGTARAVNHLVQRLVNGLILVLQLGNLVREGDARVVLGLEDLRDAEEDDLYSSEKGRRPDQLRISN